MGTLATMPMVIVSQINGVVVHGLVLLVVTVIGLWAADLLCREWQREDPQEIVIDESAGILLTLWFVPSGVGWWLAGFLLFRLFDIWKPWVIGWCDRTIKGGLGVMLDDLVAGLFANLLLNLANQIIR